MTKDEQIETLKSALRYYADNLHDFVAKRARDALAAVEAPPIDIEAAYKRLCQSTLAEDIIAVHRAAAKAHAALPQHEKQMRELRARKDLLRGLEPPSIASGYAFDMSRQQWHDFIDAWFKKEYGM